ncbi:MAG: DUF6663 family protein [Haloferacaceae archaeon]
MSEDRTSTDDPADGADGAPTSNGTEGASTPSAEDADDAVGDAALPTTGGRYRVLPAAGGVRPFLDVDDGYEPTGVRAGEGALADAAPDAGNLVDATLAWVDGEAVAREVSVVRRTRYAFADGVTDLFEAAREAFREAEAAGDGVNSRVTRSTDGEPNGVVYTFAEPPGRDLFDEFRRGHRPIDPLVDRVNEARGADERAAFVLRPTALSCVVVYVVFRPDGILAETVRDTYL